MKLQKLAGATSEIWQIFIRDSSSVVGAGLTGLVFNTSGLTAYYHRDTDTTATAISLVIMTAGTFTSSGFKEIDATHMPGWYQFCPPDAAIASGAKSCGFHLKGAANMAPVPIEVQLSAVNPDSTGFGLVDVTSNLTKVNGHVVTDTTNGIPDVNAKNINNATAPTLTGDAYARLGAAGAGLTALGDTRIAHLDADISSRMATFPLPTNFSSLGISATGKINEVVLTDTLTTNNDKTGYALTAGEHTNIASDTQTGLTSQGYTTTRAGYLDTLNGLVAAIWASVSRTLTAFSFTVSTNANATETAIKAKTDNLPSDPASESLVIAAVGSLGSPMQAGSSVALATSQPNYAPSKAGDAMTLTSGERTSIATAVWGTLTSVSLTALQGLKVILAACGGKAAGLATTSVTYRDVDDTKNVISATVDANGNRTAITLNP